MLAEFWFTSTACIDWVLGELDRGKGDKLRGIGGLFNGSVKSKDAVLLIHAD